MTEIIWKISCGNCGGDTFTVDALVPIKARGNIKSLRITCTACNSATIVKPDEPKLVTQWPEGSEGIIANLEDAI